MFLYAMNHLVGYDAWTIDQLKGYGNAKVNGFTTLSHAHPEIEVPGVEVTTGPLGQGIANAVGLAIASKNLAATFNRPGHDIIQSRIYCMTGDGCLMEGVAQEGKQLDILNDLLNNIGLAISMAGHLKLDNLVLLYDNNAVTCDGPLEWINTEDVNAKMRAMGWEVLDVEDGSYNVDANVSALQYAKTGSGSRGKPVFINIRTIIGVGTAMAGTYKAHHGAFDAASVAQLKERIGVHRDSTHIVPPRAAHFFRERRAAGIKAQNAWETALEDYAFDYPELAELLRQRQRGCSGGLKSILDAIDSSQFIGQATRDANNTILQKLWPASLSLCGGGADLVNSNKFPYADSDVFHPQLGYRGRYIRNGIREHAMASVANGLAAYSKGTFLPVTATFFMFYLYAAPGVRMGALSQLQVIHIATHDSFAEGQNGPTHQPVELDSLYRAMPNLNYIRPCDGEELIGAWECALGCQDRPSMLSIARDPVAAVLGTDRQKVKLGAYIIDDVPEADLTLVSCGSNLHYTLDASKRLQKRSLKVRLVSMPSMDLFDTQPESYRSSIFLCDGKPIVSVEEYIATAWAKYVTASVGMTTYGYSASNTSNYRRFELDGEGIEKRVLQYLDLLNGRDARGAGWRQI